MVAEEDQPALELVRRGGASWQIAGHRTLVDHQAQLQQFAMNPRRSPTILAGHPPDESLHLRWDTGATRSLGPGYPPPEQLETLTLPINHGVRLDKDKGVGPVAPDLAEQNPEGSVGGQIGRT